MGTRGNTKEGKTQRKTDGWNKPWMILETETSEDTLFWVKENPYSG